MVNAAGLGYNADIGEAFARLVPRNALVLRLPCRNKEGGPAMSRQVTLTLPEELHRRAQRWAAITQQDLDEALIDALCIALTLASDLPRSSNPIQSLSDEELLDRCRIAMDPAQGRKLSSLLEKQRMGMLTAEESRELDTLIHIRNQLWIRQSEALEEVQRRGLREPSFA
jgi:hypothetical protein